MHIILIYLFILKINLINVLKIKFYFIKTTFIKFTIRIKNFLNTKKVTKEEYNE